MPRAAFLMSLAMFLLCTGCTHEVSPVTKLKGLSGMVHAIARSRDGKYIAAAGEGDVHVWDAQTHEQIAQTDGHARHGADYYSHTGLDFSPNDQWLAFGGANGSVILWNFRTGEKLTLVGQSSTVCVVRFSPDGRSLATASGGLGYAQPVPVTTGGARLQRSAFEMVIQPMRVILFDTASGETISDIDASGMLSIVFSDDAALFAGERIKVTPQTSWPLSLNSPEARSAQAEVRRTRTGDLLATFEATGLPTAISDDGKLWSGRSIYDIRTGKKLRDVPQGRPIFVDGGRRFLDVQSSSNPHNLWPVATVGWCRIAYVDVATGWRHDLGRFHGNGFEAALQNVDGYSPDRLWVVDRQMRLWRVPR